jgi:transglutaminase-like putative cysteine protease
MRGTRHLGLVAAAATLLAAAPLSSIFARWTWLIESCLAVALVAGAAMLARWLRAPIWAQALGMLVGLLMGLTWIFPSGEELLGLLPTPATFVHFVELASHSVEDMRSYGIEVPDTDPLLFITVLGVGGVAMIVDLLTVGLRRPALAGLPMLAIYSVPVAVYVDSVPPVPFIIGAVGFLGLLAADNIDRVRRFGRRFTGDGRDVDVWEPSPLAAAGRRLSVIGVALAVLLPVVIPGMTTGLLSRYGPAGNGNGVGQGRGGSPTRIDLFAALSGELNEAKVTNLLTVTTTEPDPFYLRFGVADELREDGFRIRNPNGQPLSRALPKPQDSPPKGVSYTRYRAKVEISSNFSVPLLPTYVQPTAMQDLGSGWLYDPNLQIIYSNRNVSKGKKYSFDYVRAEYSPAVLAAEPSLPSDSPLRRQLTTVPQVSEVDELVTRLIAGQRNDYGKVRAIYDYFSRDNHFTYSLSTQGGTSSKDIVNFLTNRKGFCQQYAAAMAWLVRAAGVPARVAFGFTNGSDVADGKYVLTNRNLHAWTEVYFTGVGWVPFDATPASSVPGSARSAWAPDTDAPAPTSSSAASTTPTGADPSAGPAGAQRPDQDPDAGFDPTANAAPAGSPAWPWWTALGVILALVLLALPALRRALLRRRRRARSPVAARAGASVSADSPPGVARVVVTGAEAERIRAEAHAAWDELLDTLIDFRLPVDPTETPRATADRLVRDGPADGPAAEGARLLGRAEERARYARDPLPAAQLGDALRSVRRAVSAGANRRTRLVAATLPPSVLLRWRLRVMDSSSGFVLAAGRLRSGLLARWSPRRLLANRPAR